MNIPRDVSLTSSHKSCPVESVRLVIVLNLNNLNIFPDKPGRSWVNNTGVPSLDLINIYRKRIRGVNRAMPKDDTIMSMNLFAKLTPNMLQIYSQGLGDQNC